MAVAQTFNIWTGGIQLIPADTLEVSASGGTGSYTAGFPLGFQNTGNIPLDLEFLLDDTGIIAPAQFAMGCTVGGGCYGPGFTAGFFGTVLQPGQTMQLISPFFECFDPSCWGTHLAKITFSDISGAAVPVTIHLQINIPTGVGVGEQGSMVFNMFPNPAGDKVQFNLDYTVTELVISDLTGRVLYTAFPDAALNETVDVSAFENGVYLVSVFTGGALHTGRLMVQH
jgi:hypothetical protein